MTKKVWGVVLAALLAGVVILAWMNGSYFLSSCWGMLGLLMLAEKLNQRYGWTLAIKTWLKRKDDKDLPTFLNDRYTGKDKVKK